MGCGGSAKYLTGVLLDPCPAGGVLARYVGAVMEASRLEVATVAFLPESQGGALDPFSLGVGFYFIYS